MCVDWKFLIIVKDDIILIYEKEKVKWAETKDRGSRPSFWCDFKPGKQRRMLYFFEDVCTVNELLSLSQRFEVAKMLRDQKTYLDIAEKTGASTATISRVNRSLNYGNDGYDMVFARMAASETNEA